MNNEVLGKIEEYNNSGLFNEPITFSSNANCMNAATLLNLLTPPAGSGFGPFSFSFPKENTVELMAEQVVDMDLIRNDPAAMEMFIRKELARKLADKLIEEDLVTIQTDDDIETLTTRVRAKIKIIQE